MTAKRFIVDDCGTLIDMHTRDTFDYVSDVCSLLNEQHEQIQELIQSSKELEEDCQSTFNAMNRKQDDLYRKNFKLAEENEQLKTTIQQLTNDNTKQKKKLNTTMKENEHIKTTIKDMINTERTEIGKMTLRQLWRQIQ